MFRGVLPRLTLLRAIMPRAAAPVLPTVRLRPYSPLTQAPRSSRLFQNFPARLSASPQPDPRHGSTTLPPDATLSQRLKHLIKSYGWYALGVYLIIGLLDFGVAFAGINLLGAEYVSQVATTVKESVTHLFHSKPPEPGTEAVDGGHGAAAPTGGGSEGLYAMLVLAYTVHKTLFMPVRLGLTAAFTPRLVGWLRSRGWAGREGTKRAAAEMRGRLEERRRRGSIND